MEPLILGTVPVAMLAEWATLTGVYWVSLVVAGGLLVLSVLFGGESDGSAGDVDVEADFDFDADVDLDADVDIGSAGADAGHGLELADWFSVRFLIYFAAAFGLVGTALSNFSDLSPPTVLAIAALTGLVVGQLVHQTMRYLKRSSSDSSTKPKDYLNKPARVTIAIRPPKRGEVAVQIGEHERFLAAISRRPDDAFEIGAAVGVVGFHNGTALVVSKNEFDFTQEHST